MMKYRMKADSISIKLFHVYINSFKWNYFCDLL